VPYATPISQAEAAAHATRAACRLLALERAGTSGSPARSPTSTRAMGRPSPF